MKKNIIIYIVAGAIVLVGLAAAGVVAFHNFGDQKGETTEPTLNYSDMTDFGENGYEIVEPPSEELLTNENGELVEYVTDEEGNTYVVVLETNANGEVVTKPDGEKVTANKPNTIVTKP
ncbi:MAG: hypothetical protein IJ261_03055, partial [Clostridia bacterium]|nr:hypothetical protein [Clostridia bacterium]